MNKLPFERELGILEKKKEETNPEFGKRPEERSVEELLDFGIINLNKSSGPTSHQTSDYVKKILKVKRAGHSGTLAI
jgi:H/ACA ribonucleoprotein complex subunit 4|tara:strand:+ start:2342 stop:2572 length:231 start_codon:yes stop_codon:yes gene_type:complete